jgi:hypothetical protein
MVLFDGWNYDFDDSMFMEGSGRRKEGIRKWTYGAAGGNCAAFPKNGL